VKKTLDALVRLMALRVTYGPGTAAARLPLLARLERGRLRTAGQVGQLHEILSLLYAYPDDVEVFAQVERMLRAFDTRSDLQRHRRALIDSGIAGTDIVHPFLGSTARWLAGRCGDRLRIEWDQIGNQAALEGRLPLLTLWAERPVFDEPPLEPRAWLERIRGADADAAFFIRRSAALPIAGMARDHLYEELGVTVRVTAGPNTPNRTRARVHRHPVVPQSQLLRLTRPDLVAETGRPPQSIRLVGGRAARELIDLAREAMVTRGRDLYSFAAAEPRDVRIVDCGGGLEFACIGVVAEQRLLLDAVYGFLTLQNGVPIGYALASALWRSSEIAFNIFETYRGAEAAWIYGRLLATVKTLFAADTFTVDPFQLGHGNDEGLESGAWWFYYKLGFRPRDPTTAALAREEADRVRRRPRYRTKLATLKRLVRANLFLQAGPPRHDVLGDVPMDAIGLKVTDCVTARFGSDRERAARILANEAAGRLGVPNWRRLPAGERLFWERWAPLVALLPGFDEWTGEEQHAVADIIRAKGGRRESDFVARFDAHPRLGAALIALARGDSSSARPRRRAAGSAGRA
jgi:hypothetical protein